MKCYAVVSVIAIYFSVGVALADESLDKQAFTARCVKCHGESGTGTLMLNRRLGKDKALLDQRRDLSPVFIRFVVRNGIVSMPALTRVEVTNEELDSIVRYLTRPHS